MLAKNVTIEAPRRARPRRARRSIATAVVGLLALSACTSDPGPKRVARDIIEAEAERNPSVNEECLLEQLDEFEDDDLRRIGELLGKTDADDQAEGAELLAEFEAALASCN